MIGSLRGSILDIDVTGELLVDVGGVGYRVSVPTGLLAQCQLGDQVFLYVHHRVREDGQALYGFLTLDERKVFEVLLGAHGVGPAAALAVLTHFKPDALRRVVAEGDSDALVIVPGIGKKTAARVLLDVGPKLGARDIGAAASGSGAEVREALESLGYGADEIRSAMASVSQDGVDAPELLRLCLRSLGAPRRA